MSEKIQPNDKHRDEYIRMMDKLVEEGKVKLICKEHLDFPFRKLLEGNKNHEPEK